MAEPILRATTASGDTYDDPSQDALYMLMEDLRNPDSYFRVERLDPECQGDWAKVTLNESGLYEFESSGHIKYVSSLREIHDLLTRWAASSMGARPPRLVWKFEDEDEEGHEIGPLWIDSYGDDPTKPVATEDLGWTTREQAGLIAERRGCEFVPDDGRSDVALTEELEAAVRSHFKIVERNSDGPFGSWFLTLEGHPRLRLAFDGRDRWLTLEWETSRFWSGSRQWEPLWVGKSWVDRSVPTVMRFLVSARDFAAAAAQHRD